MAKVHTHVANTNLPIHYYGGKVPGECRGVTWIKTGISPESFGEVKQNKRIKKKKKINFVTRHQVCSKVLFKIGCGLSVMSLSNLSLSISSNALVHTHARSQVHL